MKVVGISGGTGSGKTSLCNSLHRLYPEKISVLNLDDYFKDIRSFEEFKYNIEDPETIDFFKLGNDIDKLKNKRSIEVNTKNIESIPDFIHGKSDRLKINIEPKEILLVEGYLLFYDKELRESFDLTLYLDSDIYKSILRREKDKFNVTDYHIKKYLIPNYLENIKPTKSFSNFVISVDSISQKEVNNLAVGVLKKVFPKIFI